MKTLHPTLLGKVLMAFLMAGLPAAYAHAASTEFTTEPDKTMAAAQESFIKGDTKKAGEEIDKAADYVKKQSQHVFEGSKAEMDKAGAQLDKLGEGVKRPRTLSGRMPHELDNYGTRNAPAPEIRPHNEIAQPRG